MRRNKMEQKEDSLFNLLLEIEKETKELKKSLQISDSKSIIAFRGEPRDYEGTKLLPSLYRQKLTVQQEIKLFDLLNDYNVIGREEKKNLQKAIAAQHYLATSRLLDITFNALVAIYFATSYEKEKQSEDGYIYIFCLPQHFSPSSEYIEKYYDDMLKENGNELILKKNFKVVTHGCFNERIKLQKGGFIFFPASNITRIPSCFYRRIKIEGRNKKLIRKQLADYFAVYESTLFPEKDKLSDVIFESIKKDFALEDTGNNIESELNSYFENLVYEINSYVYKQELTQELKKNIMRRVRKYEQDLFFALDQLEEKIEKEGTSRLLDVKRKARHDFENLRAYVKRELEKCSYQVEI
ncbi:FRG domain-containing protein [Bacillus mycoides]|nr:FRG domain-containing protein [Bacillus mycoides]